MMRKNNYFKLLLVLFSGLSLSAGAQTTTFSYTGAVQAYTMPAGVTCVTVDARGASGGMAGPVGGGLTATTPGKGGRTQALLTVPVGAVLNIYVGGVGDDGTGGTSFGGYNGGGNANAWTPASPTYTGGAGGGASDVQLAPYGLTNRVIVAGGGGGAGFNGPPTCTGDQPGADGGGVIGASATTCVAGLIGAGYTTVTPPTGGTAVAGGAGGVLCCAIPPYTSGSAGTFGIGGDNNSDGGIGGGGGGGYYGGGGGVWTGGGGGSSYTAPVITSGVIHTQGYNTGDGVVILTPGALPPAGIIVGPATVCTSSTGTYTNPTATGTLSWTSSNPAIATIGGTTGIVTGVSAGVFIITCVITTPCGFSSTTMTVTINPLPAPIAGPGFVCLGNIITLSDATPGGTWSSLAPLTASVDLAGNVTGNALGTAIIQYTVLGCSANKSVTVNNAPAAIVGVDTLCITSTTTYTDPSTGGVWSSTAPGSVSIGSSSGIITPITPGTTPFIIYTVGGCLTSKPIFIQDNPNPVTGGNDVCQGNSIPLIEGSLWGYWSTSAPAIASVSSVGIVGTVTGLAPGVVTISYTKPHCPAQIHLVTVNANPASITGPTAICVGLSTTLADATPGGIWSSTNPLASISTSGVVTCSIAGITDTIYYSLPTTGCYSMAVVNISAPPPGITGHDHICQGAADSLFNADSTHTGVWSSTDLSIARINAVTGADTGISAGAVVISYTLSNGCFATDSFTVMPLIPASVTVTGPPGIICAKDTVTLLAHPLNGGTPTYQWKKFSSIPFPTTDDSLRYPPIHGDVIMCYMTTHGICSVRDTVIDTFAINVYPDSVKPIVTIVTPSPDSITYIGEVITFNSVVTWGGTHPSYQWLINNLPVAGATNSSFATPIYREDTVQLTVIGNPPCPASTPSLGASNKIIIHAGYLGINGTLGAANSLSLFPNPNSGSFTLNGKLSSNSGKEIALEVSNIIGQVVYKGTALPQDGIINQQIALGNLAGGTYILRVHTETGTETFHFVISN